MSNNAPVPAAMTEHMSEHSHHDMNDAGVEMADMALSPMMSMACECCDEQCQCLVAFMSIAILLDSPVQAPYAQNMFQLPDYQSRFVELVIALPPRPPKLSFI
ncbi:hypothetical protein ACFO4O_14315 [Glaciecola siphonariae]|uniref:Uncharacterized protein n=1 Tax=Glaciecola siphonariae TaxID=521012 RepID=A0ABV9LZK4_9ALTE